ncbi:MAG: sialidase family protein [Planctomycetota bacterium]|nr:sialidase family protein [Planctomycetota bacterium]
MMKINLTAPALYGSLALLSLGCLLAEAVPLDSDAGVATASRQAKATAAADDVRVKVVKDRSTGDFRTCRKTITGPGVNEHPPYVGCTGFVGWESVMRRSNGQMLCSFNAGYWHGSHPTPVDIKPDLLKSYQRAGFPTDVNAPTGGRSLICRSEDDGKTWSRPTTLVDTPGDDRHPVIVELPDGALLCVFFVSTNWYGYDAPPKGCLKNTRVASIRSTDGGATWSEPVYMPSPFKYYDRMCGKPVVLPNGSVLLSTYGKEQWTTPEQLGVYRSDDSGKSWRFVSRLESSVHALDEPAICRAADGTIVMIARPDGEVAFSRDEGRTWTKPQAFGVKMVAPCLLTLRDGTIACIFGWGATGGIQIIWSDDGGRTWTTPAKGRGFKIDNSVYVYAIGCEMPDGSIYVVYYDPRGKQTKTAIWGLHLRIRKDRQGIDILPMI